MKILFYHASAFNKAPFCEQLDEAERLHREGHEVYFATCGGAINACAANFLSNTLDCKVCQCAACKTLKLLSKDIHLVTLPHIDNTYTWQYTNAEELKHVVYRDVPIGYSVLSTYISQTRNMNPLIDANARQFFDHLLDEAAKLVDAIDILYHDIQPDKLCTFNGRLFESSPVVQYAISRHIPFDINELIGGRSKPYYKVIFRNHIAHDIEYMTELINNSWSQSKKPEEERIAIGKSFFENRRQGVEAGDKVYIANQQKGLLPSDWDAKKHNIVFFNSSEDEFASVGDAYDSYALYPSQLEGIKRILELTKDRTDIHFYVRVHPNLTNVTYRYHLDLYDLPKQYSNVTVIPAKEKVSTYSLMDAADKIIVFGSTMGIESSYWGKPVILLAGAMYYNLDVCHVPHSEKEMLNLVLNLNLPAATCSRTQYYKFGFYFLDTERSISSKSFDYFNYNSFEVAFGKQTFHGTYCQKILGSSKLFAYIVAIGRKLAQIVSKNRYHLPLAEHV